MLGHGRHDIDGALELDVREGGFGDELDAGDANVSALLFISTGENRTRS